MRLESALYSSKEGMTANGQAISVVGDNVANSNTIAFKTMRPEFADLLPGGENQSEEVPDSGNGSKITAVRTILINGIMEPTGRQLDVGIDGEGFFSVGDTAAPLYTRAGNFDTDADGFLVTDSGYQVLGYAPSTTTLGPINLNTITTNATPTANVEMFGNIPSNAALTTPPADPATFKDIAEVASFVTNVTTIDSLGENHSIQVAFFRTGANTWTVQGYIDGEDVGGTAGDPVKLGQDLTLNFDTTGLIPEANQEAAVLTVDPAYSNGSTAGNIAISIGNFTQFAAPGQISSLTQDGVGVGNITSYEFDKNGDLYAIMDNGQNVLLATLPLADFNNVGGLQRIGNNLFSTSTTSGEVTLHTAGTEGVGLVSGGFLERSNVDISEQFINLVLYQRGYQANSQTLNATSGLIRETISLIR